jgi:hypothetical protein
MTHTSYTGIPITDGCRTTRVHPWDLDWYQANGWTRIHPPTAPCFTPHAKQGAAPTAWAAKLETKRGPYGPIPQASAAFTREGHN